MKAFVGNLERVNASRSLGSKYVRKFSLFIAPSLYRIGRGVFAGTELKHGVIMDEAATISIPKDLLENWGAVNDYAMGEPPVIVFGVGMIINHGNPRNLEILMLQNDRYETATSAEQRLEPQSVSTEVSLECTRTINVGEEIFSTYGDKNWFESRDIILNPTLDDTTKRYTIERLMQSGFCITDVYVDESVIAGKGLFAKKDFLTGDIVSISPVLLLPKNAVQSASNETVLINYCLADKSSDVALLPIGYPALANHGGQSSNLTLEWYSWTGEESKNQCIMNLSEDEVILLRHVNLDMSYRASKNISAGDELTFDYGLAWEEKWSIYTDSMLSWETAGCIPGNEPIFRHPIGVPKSLHTNWF